MGEKDHMRPTKTPLVRLSLREFQELGSSAQALQSQLRGSPCIFDVDRSRKSEPVAWYC